MNDEGPESSSKIGRFIQTYHGFLSTFVIGAAGLIATSVWQYRQSTVAAGQARSEQVIARTKADNDWRIARAEILSKNLSVLATQGPSTVDQRFGVLLSLTRGEIIDPELAVAYAVELGRDNSTYMRAILDSTSNKNYHQLAQAFKLTCLQRFGLMRQASICKDDSLADRSDAIARQVQDDLDQRSTVGASSGGALELLRDEHEVQNSPAKLAWLFTPYLQDLYDRRQWNDITKFENFSTGARLVAALVLASSPIDDLVSATETKDLERVHGELRKWLLSYLFGRSCNADCRGRLVDFMLSEYFEGHGDYDEPLRRLLLQSRGEAGPTLGYIRSRLLWCQVDGDDLSEFRDRALVPAVMAALADPREDRAILEDVVGLAALVPEPPSTDVTAQTAWKTLVVGLNRNGQALQMFNKRKAIAARERTSSRPTSRNVNFCKAPDGAANAAPKLDQ